MDLSSLLLRICIEPCNLLIKVVLISDENVQTTQYQFIELHFYNI